mgnify:CR=1 FL=1
MPMTLTYTTSKCTGTDVLKQNVQGPNFESVKSNALWWLKWDWFVDTRSPLFSLVGGGKVVFKLHWILNPSANSQGKLSEPTDRLSISLSSSLFIFHEIHMDDKLPTRNAVCCWSPVYMCEFLRICGWLVVTRSAMQCVPPNFGFDVRPTGHSSHSYLPWHPVYLPSSQSTHDVEANVFWYCPSAWKRLKERKNVKKEQQTKKRRRTDWTYHKIHNHRR